MELTADEVDKIEEVRQLTEDLIEYAESNDSEMFDIENLVILEAQLDALHQALSLAVSQKDLLQKRDS
jgi:hypothetical protein